MLDTGQFFRRSKDHNQPVNKKLKIPGACK